MQWTKTAKSFSTTVKNSFPLILQIWSADQIDKVTGKALTTLHSNVCCIIEAEPRVARADELDVMKLVIFLQVEKGLGHIMVPGRACEAKQCTANKSTWYRPLTTA
uniref:Uncharacterized protein n=1 Tax=Rhipicephalus zambeziensis TaxID=60191 RepID=A0A224Y9R9_9ACAR